MTLYEKALEIATREHEGQTRRDGKLYISHPLNVEEIARFRFANDVVKLGFPIKAMERMAELISVVAILHDVLEDCDITFDELRDELSTYCSVEDLKAVMTALKLLTKKKGESYFKFIEAMRENGIATIVKLADLEHNLSDLEPGNLRDKYLFARDYLNSV